MKLFRGALAGAALFVCALLPAAAMAQAASTLGVLNGSGGAETLAAIIDASSHKIAGAFLADHLGAVIDPATSGNQTSQITQETAINTILGTVTASPTANTIADRLKTLNATLASPFQAGGSIGNTAFGLSAGENHVGEVGGNIKAQVQVTPTTTAVAFTSGWAVGSLQTIANASRVSGGTGLLQSVQVLEKTAQTATFDIFLFSDTSLSSTCTNAQAFVLSASDWAKVVGVVHVTDVTAGNTTTVAQALGSALPYSTAVTSLYACAVVRGTPTWGSTTDLTFSYNFIRN